MELSARLELNLTACTLENREILGARMMAGIALNCVTTSCMPARDELVARRVG